MSNPDLTSEDYYKILGVSKTADVKEIQKAYKKSALRWHPDKWAHKSDSEKTAAEKNFKIIAEAYEVLNDKEKRKLYDSYGKAGIDPSYRSGGGGGGSSSSGGFPGGFGGFGGGGGNSSTTFTFVSGPGGTQSFKVGGMTNSRAEDIFKQFFGNNDPFNMNMDDDDMGMGGMSSSFGGGGSSSSMGGPNGGGAFSHPMFASMFSSSGMGPGNAFQQIQMGPNGSIKMSTSSTGSGGSPGSSTGGRRRRRTTQNNSNSTNTMSNNQQNQNRPDIIPSGSKVSIFGLQNQPDLNGESAVVTDYDSNSGRYRVQITNTNGPIALKPSNLCLETRGCTITGVQSNPQMNGKNCTIIRYDSTKDRYVCEVSQSLSDGNNINNNNSTGPGALSSLAPGNIILPMNCRVRIVGLESESAQQHNGRWGKIVEIHRDDPSGSDVIKYTVDLGSNSRIKCKMINCRVHG